MAIRNGTEAFTNRSVLMFGQRHRLNFNAMADGPKVLCRLLCSVWGQKAIPQSSVSIEFYYHSSRPMCCCWREEKIKLPQWMVGGLVVLLCLFVFIYGRDAMRGLIERISIDNNRLRRIACLWIGIRDTLRQHCPDN